MYCLPSPTREMSGLESIQGRVVSGSSVKVSVVIPRIDLKRILMC